MGHQYKSKELKQEVMKPLPLWATEPLSTWTITQGGGREVRKVSCLFSHSHLSVTAAHLEELTFRLH